MHTFSREFREGMVSPHRQRLLGDYYNSDPIKWQWGGPANKRVDLILMVFGKDEAIAENYFMKGIRFDTQFSLATNDRMYCSEFVYKTIILALDVGEKHEIFFEDTEFCF